MDGAMAQFPLLFGFIAATIHVVSGPDHLAAVAPLAINTKFRPWMIGMSWGIGHLVGMLLIGVLFLFFRELLPVDLISAHSEKIVGLLLILIGCWSFLRLYRLHQQTRHKHMHVHRDNQGNAYVHTHAHEHETTGKHLHTHMQTERQTYLAALGIGILHGLAGFSHIFHMLPTLAFGSSFEAGLYLTGFGAGTVVAMILFSILLGFIGHYSHRFSKDYLFKLVNGLAGGIAIFVGVFWIWNTW
jgi:sulfite exporter TauE/SafE